MHIRMYIRMYTCRSQSVTDTRGLEIVSVAIPMASSCSICLFNSFNSQCMLLSILHCAGGD